MRSSALITILCTVVLASFVVVDVSGDADNETKPIAGEPKRGLMRWLSLGSTLASDSKKQPEESYSDGGIGKGNNNKVSELLHFLHRKSSSSLSKRPRQRDEQSAKDQQQQVEEDVEPDYKSMSDQGLLESFCEGRVLINLCKKAMNAALRKSPEDVAKIAQAIRNKPAHVDANKLLAHKVFEIGVVKIESKGYDKALDKAITVAATRNPYVYSAVKAIDLTRKLT